MIFVIVASPAEISQSIDFLAFNLQLSTIISGYQGAASWKRTISPGRCFPLAAIDRHCH
jgi:hypothetical protein